MPLYEIVYQSFASKDFSIAELNELMVLSRVNNQKSKVTGCLLYHKRTFIQVLEGEERTVKALYQKIKSDTRHTKVKLVWKDELDERGFSGWSMSLTNLNEKRIAALFSGFLDNGTLDYDVAGIVTTSKALLKKMKDNL